MKSVVFIKRVPDTDSRIRIAPGGTEIETAGLKYVMNPYDESALEAALQIRSLEGEGTVTVVSAGIPESVDVLRNALARGADDAVLLTMDTGSEGLPLAEVVAAELRDRDFDIAFFGVQSIDDNQGAVGPMVAELLELPAATSVVSFRAASGSVEAIRAIEGGVEVVQLRMPCILTITKGGYEPRLPSLKGIMAAKTRPLEEKPVTPGPAQLRTLSLELLPERTAGRIVGEGVGAVPELIRLLHEDVKVI
jgi:electron transfer flavoprotein beta subunit